MNDLTTSEILKTLRKNRGYSQQEVASLIGIDRTSYVKYEKGIIKPTKKLKELANLYNVSTDYILGIEQYEQNNVSSSSNNYVKAAIVAGEIMTMDDEQKISLTIEVLNRMKTMSTEQIKRLNDFLKVMK